MTTPFACSGWLFKYQILSRHCDSIWLRVFSDFCPTKGSNRKPCTEKISQKCYILFTKAKLCTHIVEWGLLCSMCAGAQWQCKSRAQQKHKTVLPSSGNKCRLKLSPHALHVSHNTPDFSDTRQRGSCQHCAGKGHRLRANLAKFLNSNCLSESN